MYRDHTFSAHSTNPYHRTTQISHFYDKPQPYNQHPEQQKTQIPPPTYNPTPDINFPSIDKGVTYLGESRRQQSSKSIWCLLGLLVIALIIGAVYYFYRQAIAHQINSIEGEPAYSRDGRVVCRNGFFVHNGKCIICPSGSRWTGFACQYQKNPGNMLYDMNKNPQYVPQDLASFIQKIYRGKHFSQFSIVN